MTATQYAIDAMQQAIGALRVSVSDANQVGFIIRRLEVSIEKLGRLDNQVLPPPIPELVQQVRHDADLSQADQTPMFLTQDDVASGKAWGGPAPWAKPFDADDDAKTRIISRAREAQFTE